MAIRIRVVNGVMIAICAARSVEKSGDIYLDDAAHGALSNKFALDWNGNQLFSGGSLPYDEHVVAIMEREKPSEYSSFNR